MDPDFPRLKIERARKHFLDLTAEIADFDKNDTYSWPIERHIEEGFYLYRLKVTQAPPDYWSSIVGDFVHNLRSSLDNVMWELLGEPLDTEWRFSIYNDETRFLQDYAKLPQSLPPGAYEVIENLQFHKGLNGPDARIRHTLHILNRMSNGDKHRAPQVARFAMNELLYVDSGAGLDLDAYQWVFNEQPLANDSEIARYLFPPGEEPDVEANFELFIGFYERTRKKPIFLVPRSLRKIYDDACTVVFARLGQFRTRYPSAAIPNELRLP